MGFAPDEYTGKPFGKYEVLCRLAVGGMAEIFLGFTRAGPFSFQPLVLKRLLSDQREDPTAMRLLIDEARNTATLNHPNVARVFDLEVTSEDVLLVIQFINGANFEELIKASLEQKELLPVGFILAVMRDAAQGLNHAHQHKDANGQPRPIVHRDVTPRNIMVGFDGKGRVLDFGIARKLGAESRTMAGMVRGTTAYMSPEQAIGNPPDHRSDLFSIGTMLHEALVGQRLFSRENPAKEMAAVYEAPIPLPSQANRRVPKNLDSLVMKLLERPVQHRYQSATDFVRELNQVAGNAIWPPERCGELVRTLFASRQKSLEGLLDRIAVASSMADEKTGTGVPGLRGSVEDDAEPRTMIDRPNLGRAIGTSTNSSGSRRVVTSDEAASVEVATDPGGRPVSARPTDPNREVEDDGMPTNFFRPRFDTQDPGSEVEETHTSVPGKSRSVFLVLGGLVAMVVGAVGGAVIYGSMVTPTNQVQKPPEGSTGVGRVSIGCDRPAEVQLGGQILGKTPVVDVYLPSGPTVVRLREENGPWHEAVLNVKKDQVNRFELRLDALPIVP